MRSFPFVLISLVAACDVTAGSSGCPAGEELCQAQAPGDDVEGELTRVTITLDAFPMPGARVVVNAADGTFISEATTDDMGLVEFALDGHGTITLVEEYNDYVGLSTRPIASGQDLTINLESVPFENPFEEVGLIEARMMAYIVGLSEVDARMGAAGGLLLNEDAEPSLFGVANIPVLRQDVEGDPSAVVQFIGYNSDGAPFAYYLADVDLAEVASSGVPLDLRTTWPWHTDFEPFAVSATVPANPSLVVGLGTSTQVGPRLYETPGSYFGPAEFAPNSLALLHPAGLVGRPIANLFAMDMNTRAMSFRNQNVASFDQGLSYDLESDLLPLPTDVQLSGGHVSWSADSGSDEADISRAFVDWESSDGVWHSWVVDFAAGEATISLPDLPGDLDNFASANYEPMTSITLVDSSDWIDYETAFAEFKGGNLDAQTPDGGYLRSSASGVIFEEARTPRLRSWRAKRPAHKYFAR
jgi:hypothetical protein